jgi:hypothetical protein
MYIWGRVTWSYSCSFGIVAKENVVCDDEGLDFIISNELIDANDVDNDNEVDGANAMTP